MARFTYTIVNKEGARESGSAEAISLEEAAAQVKKNGWFVTLLKQEKEITRKFLFFGKEKKLSSFERIIFTDHLSAMIRSGIPLVEALDTYAVEEKKNESLIFQRMAEFIVQGKKLSEAMASYPKIFTPFYLALVRSGELTGTLSEALDYIAQELRREHEFKEKIKAALFYPILVLSVAFLVILLLTLVVIPKVTLITKSFTGDLPLITRIVSSAASLMTAFGPMIALLLLISVIGIIALLRNRKVKEMLDPYSLRLPLFGKILKKYILARFLRVLGSCIKYGISLTSAFATIDEVVGNSYYREACRRIDGKILRGLSLFTALSEEDKDLFPRIIVQAIKGAEKTGHVDETMLRLSGFYEDEIDRELRRITQLIEPVLVVILGIIVAAIAISVIAPIYQMTSRIK